MSGDLLGDLPSDAGSHKVADGRAPIVVKEPAGHLRRARRLAPNPVEVPCAVPVPVEDVSGHGRGVGLSVDPRRPPPLDQFAHVVQLAGLAELLQKQRMTKAQGTGPCEITQGLSWRAFLLVGESPVREDLAIFGLQLDGLVVILDGPVELAFLSVNITPVAEGFRKIGFQVDGLVVILDGPVELALAIIDIAPVGEGFRKVGFQADGLAEVADGPVPLAFTFVGKAPVGEGDGEILPDETPRLNVPGTSNDSDVGMVASEVTPSNFLREIRLGGWCPCGQKEDGEGYVSDNISPCCRGISAFQMDKSSRIGITNATGEVFGRGPSALAALSGRPERGALRQTGITFEGVFDRGQMTARGKKLPFRV